MAETTVSIKLVDLPAVRAIIKKGDELAQAIEHADRVLLEPHILEAFERYQAVREEWMP